MGKSNTLPEKPKNVKEEFEMFLLSTSIKGIPRVFKGRTLLHKVVWLMTVIAGFSLGTYQLSKLIASYMDYDVTTKLRIVTDYNKFPDITLCTLGIFGEQKAYQQYLHDVRVLYENNNDSAPGLNWIQGYLSSPSAFIANKESYISSNSGSGVYDIVTQCIWSSHSKGFLNCNKSKIVESKLNNRFSKCKKIAIPGSDNQIFRLNPEIIEQWTGIINVGDFINSTITEYNIEPTPTYSTGIIAFIHPAGSLPEADEGILIAPGTYSIISVSASHWSHLPPPYSKCKSIYESHSNDEYSHIMSNALAGDQKYSKTICEHIYKQNVYISQCNCLSVRYHSSVEQRQNYSLCVKLDSNVDLMEQRIKCSSQVRMNNDDVAEMCPDQCEEITYNKGVSQVRPHDFTYSPLPSTLLELTTMSDPVMANHTRSIVLRIDKQMKN